MVAVVGAHSVSRWLDDGQRKGDSQGLAADVLLRHLGFQGADIAIDEAEVVLNVAAGDAGVALGGQPRDGKHVEYVGDGQPFETGADAADAAHELRSRLLCLHVEVDEVADGEESRCRRLRVEGREEIV